MRLSEKAISLNPGLYRPLNEQETIMKFSLWESVTYKKKEFTREKNQIEENFETWAQWVTWINMSLSELKEFYDSPEGKQAGMKTSDASKMGIDTGRESARWLMKMIPTGGSWSGAKKNWTSKMWEWARKQNSFNARMTGTSKRAKGNPWYDEKIVDGKKIRVPTRILLALKIWGHDPEKKRRSKPVRPKNLD